MAFYFYAFVIHEETGHVSPPPRPVCACPGNLSGSSYLFFFLILFLKIRFQADAYFSLANYYAFCIVFENIASEEKENNERSVLSIVDKRLTS